MIPAMYAIDVWLQWSRDLLIAERHHASEIDSRIDALQWSRDLLIAESRPTAHRVKAPRRASMEPRSFDRGKLSIGASAGRYETGFNGAAIF